MFCKQRLEFQLGEETFFFLGRVLPLLEFVWQYVYHDNPVYHPLKVRLRPHSTHFLNETLSEFPSLKKITLMIYNNHTCTNKPTLDI